MTTIEQVRLLINDKAKVLFADDADIQAFLDNVNQNVYLAAADALDSLAAKTAMTESFTIGAYSERANANALFKLAEAYRKRAEDNGIAPDGNAVGYDASAEIAATEFNAVEIINNITAREGL